MRNLKRKLAVILSAAIIFSSIPCQDIYAAEPSVAAKTTTEQTISENAAEQTESKESTETKDTIEKVEGEVTNSTEETDSEKLENIKEPAGENEEEVNKDPVEESKGETTGDESEKVEVPEIGNLESVPLEDAPMDEILLVEPEVLEEKLNYAYIESPQLELSETQKIVLSIGDDDLVLTEAKLHYTNETTGEKGYWKVDTVEGNLLLFSESFSEKAVYHLDSLEYSNETGIGKYIFLDADMDMSFGVDCELSNESGSVTVGEDGTIEEGSDESSVVDTDVIVMNEDGSQEVVDSIETAIEQASNSLPADENEAGLMSLSNGTLVVVLDPGHDSTHNGGTGNGLKEHTLTLKIAQYCKDELEQYQNVKVYLTRTSSSCPNPGTTSTQDNKKRVEYAKSVGADIYVSIHLNTSSSTSANGAEVYYPNSNYNSTVGSEGKALATKVMQELVALGLNSRGIKIRYSEDGTKYPDGSLADYYGVIHQSKLLGFPGIIVEHAFMTNSGDANEYLKSESGLKSLGVADATGIAQYFGLGKAVTVTSNGVTVLNQNNVTGTVQAQVTGVVPNDKINKISFAVWSKADQSDMKWYDVGNNGTGSYLANISISNHNYNYGSYQIHAYAYDIYGTSHYLGGSGCTFTAPAIKVSAVLDASGSWVQLTASELKGYSNVTGVRFGVWSEAGGQDDLRWYAGTKDTTGNWYAPVPIAYHKTAGRYQVHAYVDYGGNTSYGGSTSFTVEGIKTGSLKITGQNPSTGTFQAVVSGVSSKVGIKTIKVAVWGKSDQSDMKWYTASVQNDGTYVAAISIANHGGYYGIYNVHAYAEDNNGIEQYAGGTAASISRPASKVSAVLNAPQTWFQLTAVPGGITTDIKGIRFGVWSEAGGQDDLRWYSASKDSSGNWIVPVPVSYHKTAGNYQVHAYMDLKTGGSQFIGSSTFNVEGITGGKVSASNYNAGTGTFGINASGMSSKAGIQTVKAAVWSQSNQSDMKWYSLNRQSDGTYQITADIANHKYNYGTYVIHIYATDNNGVEKYIAGTSITAKQPTAKVSADLNIPQTWFQLKASNVGVPGGVKTVRFAVWSDEGGQDDLKWYTGAQNSSGDWVVPVPVSYHKTAGRYEAHCYVTSNTGVTTFIGADSFKVTGATASKVLIAARDESAGIFTAQATGIFSASGISKVEFAVWSKSDQSDMVWYEGGNPNLASTYQMTVDVANHNNNTGIYQIHVYITDGNGIRSFAGSTSCSMINVDTGLYRIAGSSSVTLNQMMAYYNARATYPSYYASSDAPTLAAFCQMYLEECSAEGIKAEVAFCQAMKETGYLKFGGNVSITQYNFAGLGSTGAGIAGNSFASVRLGIRAQVQHLKAYASTSGLNNLCVDPRFAYVTRNTAPYVEWLGINENPYGKGWATAVNYGYYIVNMIKLLKNY